MRPWYVKAVSAALAARRTCRDNKTGRRRNAIAFIAVREGYFCRVISNVAD
jgi:hypothetical protein